MAGRAKKKGAKLKGKGGVQSGLPAGEQGGRPLAGLVDPDCTDCALWESRTMVVPGFGYPKARMVLVGEAPGRAEDLGGEPFIGRAGKLLDQCLEELGLTREDLFISNTVKCRPPKNRNPKVPEMTACRHHLEAELKAVDPVVVVSMGIIPTRWALVGTGVKWKNLSEVVGKTYRAGLGGRERTLVVNYHPAACIYNRKLIPVFKDVMGEAARLARKGRRR